MAKTATYWDEKPFETTLKYREYPQQAKGVPFFAFLFSVFVYISIFYTCNLSPSNFVNDNKFWFFISNTLILIIAADYGAFSSSKNKYDLYEEYVMHNRQMHTQARSTVPSFVSQHPETVKKASTDKEEVDEDSFQEKNNLQAITTINAHEEEEEEPEEKVLEIVVWNEPAEEEKKKKRYRRSKSEKPRRVVIDESKKILRRLDSDKEQEETTDKSVEENDEFSRMSDEELNRRVEEFIQKFNRQIRLQRAGIFR